MKRSLIALCAVGCLWSAQGFSRGWGYGGGYYPGDYDDYEPGEPYWSDCNVWTGFYTCPSTQQTGKVFRSNNWNEVMNSCMSEGRSYQQCDHDTWRETGTVTCHL